MRSGYSVGCWNKVCGAACSGNAGDGDVVCKQWYVFRFRSLAGMGICVSLALCLCFKEFSGFMCCAEDI